MTTETYVTKISQKSTVFGDNGARSITINLPEGSNFQYNQTVTVTISPDVDGERELQYEEKKMSVGEIMRQMNVNEKVVVPYEKWMSARSYATKLKATFGSVFKVEKLAVFGYKGDIQISRIK